MHESRLFHLTLTSDKAMRGTHKELTDLNICSLGIARGLHANSPVCVAYC